MTLSEAEINGIIRRLRRHGIPYFFSGKLAGALSWRVYAVRMALRGKVSLRHMLKFCLPIGGGRGTVIPLVKLKIDEDIIAYISGLGFSENEAMVFYGAPMRPPTPNAHGWLQLLVLVYQIGTLDQYHVKEFFKGGTVIDAGANVGVFSCFVSAVSPDCKIFAFEPALITATILEKNVAHLKNVTVIKKGLGRSAGEAILRVKPQESGSSSFADSGMILESSPESPLEEQRTPVTSIDDFVRENSLPGVNFIKIDAEGYERQIIEGAKMTIAQFRPLISASAYHHAGDKNAIPETVLGISPDYDYFLSTRSEEDLIFHPRTAI
jgi:FkbM family methyltransferase